MTEQRVITVSEYQQRVMVRALSDRRNEALKKGEPTEDLNEVLLKCIRAPSKKKGRDSREAR